MIHSAVQRPRWLILLMLLTTIAGPLALGCGQEGGEGARARAAISEAKGQKVTISGAGELGPEKVKAISGLLEAKGHDVGAVIVKLLKEGEGAPTLEITMWGAGLPPPHEISGSLKVAFPELAAASIEVKEMAPGTGPTPIAIEAPGEEVSAEEAKAQILEQLAAEGVVGEVQVEVQDGAEGRQVEVRIEKTVEADQAP